MVLIRLQTHKLLLYASLKAIVKLILRITDGLAVKTVLPLLGTGVWYQVSKPRSCKLSSLTKHTQTHTKQSNNKPNKEKNWNCFTGVHCIRMIQSVFAARLFQYCIIMFFSIVDCFSLVGHFPLHEYMVTYSAVDEYSGCFQVSGILENSVVCVHLC